MKRLLKEKIFPIGQQLLHTPKRFKNKQILLYSNAATMEEHLLDYHNQIQHEVSADVYWICSYPLGSRRHRFIAALQKMNIHYLAGRRHFFLHPWDLIVCADTVKIFPVSSKPPAVLYVNHGLHRVSRDGGNTLYAYGDVKNNGGNARFFSCMMEPSRRTASIIQAETPAFAGRIVYSGYKYAERIRAAVPCYDAYRLQLGIPCEAVFVCVFSTWGVHSLFHTLGNGLFLQAQKLQSKGYRFMFSVHPREYQQYSNIVTPVGPVVDKQREAGFLVRAPEDDYLPYLIAADIVLCDHSTFFELALLAEKKVILADFPDNALWRHSPLLQHKRALPCITSAGALPAALIKAEKLGPPAAMIRETLRDLAPGPGAYRSTVQTATRYLLDEAFSK